MAFSCIFNDFFPQAVNFMGHEVDVFKTIFMAFFRVLPHEKSLS